MKRLIVLGAIFAFAITSCGESEPIAVQTTETSTTISLGSGCNPEDHDRILELVEDYNEARDTIQVSSKSAYLKDIGELRAALITYRSYVRILDLPTLVEQQQLLADEIEIYLSALNRYISTEGKDTSYNDALIPMTDALYDFNVSYTELCGGY